MKYIIPYKIFESKPTTDGWNEVEVEDNLDKALNILNVLFNSIGVYIVKTNVLSHAEIEQGFDAPPNVTIAFNIIIIKHFLLKGLLN